MRYHLVLVPCVAAAGSSLLGPALVLGAGVLGGRWLMEQLGGLLRVILGVVYDGLELAAIGYGSVAVSYGVLWTVRAVMAVRAQRCATEALGARPAPSAIDPAVPIVAIAEVLRVERLAA